MNLLVTGGLGYIGSHTIVSLIAAGHKIVAYDNLYNSNMSVLGTLRRICGGSIEFVIDDLLNTPRLIRTCNEHHIDAVLHFAGLKSVPESVVYPMRYYVNNVQGTVSLVHAMQQAHNGRGIKKLIFSSSTSVYGEPNYLPIDEKHATVPIHPYGKTKLHIEQMLRDVASSDPAWQIVALRYFNPSGAHDSGLLGEMSTQDTAKNLMIYILRVACGEEPYLNIHGNDYGTSDGTGVRDYIHVMDVAEGHCAALDYLDRDHTGYYVFNLGTGRGYSVLDVVNTFEQHNKMLIPYQIKPRRLGDVGISYANITYALEEMCWRAQRDICDIVTSAWNWYANSKVV